VITSHSSRTNNSWLFAPSSLILANYYLPLNGALGLSRVLSMYKHNGVCFESPETWEVVEDDGDAIIRAITVECPNNGYYSIDIYNSNQAPSIDSYIESSMKHFIQELPFVCSLIGIPSRKIEKATNQNVEIEGIQLKFTVRSFFFLKIEYINSYFRVISDKKTSLISSQYSSDVAIESGEGFNKILASYSAV